MKKFWKLPGGRKEEVSFRMYSSENRVRNFQNGRSTLGVNMIISSLSFRSISIKKTNNLKTGAIIRQ